MSVEIDKAWRPLRDLNRLPGHMGVYQLADDAGRVIYIGYAGGRSRFGLRGEIEHAADRFSTAASMRYEVTTAYLTRYQELLMVHQARCGALPPGNRDVGNLGRLSPA